MEDRFVKMIRRSILELLSGRSGRVDIYICDRCGSVKIKTSEEVSSVIPCHKLSCSTRGGSMHLSRVEKDLSYVHPTVGPIMA